MILASVLLLQLQFVAQNSVTWDEANFELPKMTLVAESERPLNIPKHMEVFTFDGAELDGKTTQVFAILSLPRVASKDKKVPAVLLLHGGGGTAFSQWVDLWNSRGYAALAIDLCGNKPAMNQGGYSYNVERLANGGPMGWDEAILSTDKLKPENQWIYHSVAAAIRGTTILLNREEINGNVGVIGISWGGFTSLVYASADPRLRFAVSVYGGGFVDEESLMSEAYGQNPAWIEFVKIWDPKNHVDKIQCPTLLVNSVNDRFFRYGVWDKTAKLIDSKYSYQISKLDLPHSYPPEGDPREVIKFASSVLKGKKAPAKIEAITQNDKQVTAEFNQERANRAELVYTCDSGIYSNRKWQTREAKIVGTKVESTIPEGATTLFFNIFDDSNNQISSPGLILNERAI